MSDDIYEDSVAAPLSGIVCHCVPSIVLFVHMCTYEASGDSLISSLRGKRANFSASVDAATVCSTPFFSSPSAFAVHVPVCSKSTGLPGRHRFIGTMVNCMLPPPCK